MTRSQNSDKTGHRYINAVLAIVIASILLFVITVNIRSVFAAHLGTSSDIWGIEAALISKIHHFDPSTDTSTTISRVPILSMEDGMGMASDGTNLWYTILIEGFRGDGKIHKIAPTGGSDIATIPDPFGFNGSGIYALDFDNSGYLWAISNRPLTDHEARIFKIDSNTGTVLASCDVPWGYYGPAATLAIVNGKILTHSDTHVYDYNDLNEYVPPSSIGGDCVSTGNVFTLPVNVTGIDTDSAGNLLVTDLHNLYNLGHAPYSTILASQPNAFSQFSDELDITTIPETDIQTNVCAQGNVQHWDKIVFMILDPKLASKANVTSNTELDIKVLDDPREVADLKQKILNFIGAPNENKSSIKIVDVEYAIICAMQPPPSAASGDVVPPDFPNENTPSAAAKLNQYNPLTVTGMGVQVQNVNKTLQSPP
jgi:hypothetical protein